MPGRHAAELPAPQPPSGRGALPPPGSIGLEGRRRIEPAPYRTTPASITHGDGHAGSGRRFDPLEPGSALRHHPARRHAGTGNVPVGAGEDPGRRGPRPPRHRTTSRPDSRTRTPRTWSCSSCSPSVPLEQATICAFGMTRRRDRAADDDPGLAALVGCFAPVVTLVGKTWSLHLDKVTRVSREENLAMIADSVGFCARGGKTGDLRPGALLRRLARRSRLCVGVPERSGRGGGRERHPLRHERIEPARRDRGGDRGRRRDAGEVGGQRDGRDPHPQRRRMRGRQLAGGRACGRRAGAGHDERLRGAHRQRQPGLDPAGATAEDGLRLRRAGAARGADRDRPSGRRDLQPRPRPLAGLRRPQRVRPQGRHARRRGGGRRADVRAPGPEGGRKQPGDPDLGARRAGFGHGPRRSRRDRARR